MARKVLGNDPFRRGAPPRTPNEPAAAEASAERPVSPELQLPPARKARARAAAKGAKAQAPQPVVHPGTPTVEGDPRPHQDAPTAVLLGGEPHPHPGSPGVPFEAQPHAAAPSGVVLSTAPLAHPGSPSLPFEPRVHATIPIAVDVSHGPQPHAGSPSVPVDPRPHPGTPVASPLGGAPIAHAGSPTTPFEPQLHPGIPGAVELEGEPLAHPGSPSIPGDPQPHAQTPRPREEVAPSAPRIPLGSPTPLPAPEAPRPSLTTVLTGLARAVRTGIGLSSRSADVDAWGKDEQLAQLLEPIGDFLYQRYWRVHTEGIEHVPSGPCILVANHAGALPLDGPILHHALLRERPDLAEARWLLEDQVFHAPFVGLLANRLGAVRASPENALRLLEEGRPLIVFPEGFHGLSKPFSERYQLRRFGRGGYLKIALRARVPVVPIAIVGGEEAMPLLAKVPARFLGVEYLPVTLPPLPARWTIRFAPPISLAGAPRTPEDDLAWIERTNFAVRDQIEGMLQAILSQRPGVF